MHSAANRFEDSFHQCTYADVVHICPQTNTHKHSFIRIFHAVSLLGLLGWPSSRILAQMPSGILLLVAEKLPGHRAITISYGHIFGYSVTYPFTGFSGTSYGLPGHPKSQYFSTFQALILHSQNSRTNYFRDSSTSSRVTSR